MRRESRFLVSPPVGKACRLVLFWLALGSLCSSPSGTALYQGIPQFHPIHNLETSACLATGTCSIAFEDFANAPSWLSQISSRSNLAVLHWDSGIPWLIFDADPPPGADRVSYYDARLDAETLAWIDVLALSFYPDGRSWTASGCPNPRPKCFCLHLLRVSDGYGGVSDFDLTEFALDRAGARLGCYRAAMQIQPSACPIVAPSVVAYRFSTFANGMTKC